MVSRPLIILRMVDFPQPDGPKRIRRSPFSMLKFRLLMIFVLPNDLLTFSKRMLSIALHSFYPLIPDCANVLMMYFWHTE